MSRLIFEAESSNKVLLVLRILLILFFLLMASKNLGGNEQMRADFARWGYPDWFRILTACLQLLVAALLLHASVTFYGAALLACIMLGAALTHLRFDPPAAVISPLVFLGFALLLLIAYRPPLLR
jgi:putative oxidoreductase